MTEDLEEEWIEKKKTEMWHFCTNERIEIVFRKFSDVTWWECKCAYENILPELTRIFQIFLWKWFLEIKYLSRIDPPHISRCHPIRYLCLISTEWNATITLWQKILHLYALDVQRMLQFVSMFPITLIAPLTNREKNFNKISSYKLLI